MSLKTLQQDFQAWLVIGTDAQAARFGPNAQAGLSVYQNNYRASAMACLEESFAQTLAYIGGEAFHAAAARHLDDRPPESWSLDHYAAHFPAALAAAFPNDPDIAELAKLELALADAFVGPDAEPLIAGDLPHIDWDKASLLAVPTTRLLQMTSNAHEILSALLAGTPPPAAASLSRMTNVLVWRQAYVACFRPLDPVESKAVRDIVSGVSFPDLCASLVDAMGEREGVATAGAWLGRWVADGLLVNRT